MNLVTAFAASVEQHQDKIGIYWGDREYSYKELWGRTLRASARLQEGFNVKAGDRVGIWLKNCPEYIPAFYGILQAGGVVVPINNFLKADEVNFILNDAGIDVLITDTELGTHHRALQSARPNLAIVNVEEFEDDATAVDRRASGKRTQKSVFTRGAAPDTQHSPPEMPSDLAVLIYTSGTTGRPKGAMLSHGNLLHNIGSCRIVLQTVEADRFAVLLPLFHSYMITVGMLLPLTIGGSIVLVKSLHPVRNVLQELLQRQTSVLPAIPQFYRGLVNVPGKVPFPLRICLSGAAPLPVQVLKDFEARFHVPLIEGYGLSEASPVVTKNPLNATRKPGSIGLPVPNVEVSIQDDEGRELGNDEVGEVCVRGGNVMLGYWKNPEETAKAMRNGWLLTGDIGYRDSEGYYYITDRKKDMLLVNGINVYPREIEEVLYEFPGVKEAAVIGKPDSRRGEQPVAFVSPNEGLVLEETALQQFVRRKLADYKVPRKVVILSALPRNATGKVLKTALRQMPVDGGTLIDNQLQS